MHKIQMMLTNKFLVTNCEKHFVTVVSYNAILQNQEYYWDFSDTQVLDRIKPKLLAQMQCLYTLRPSFISFPTSFSNPRDENQNCSRLLKVYKYKPNQGLIFILTLDGNFTDYLHLFSYIRQGATNQLKVQWWISISVKVLLKASGRAVLSSSNFPLLSPFWKMLLPCREFAG